MALVTRLCEAHGPYEDLTLTVRDDAPRPCPECGSVGKVQISGNALYAQGESGRYERILNPQTKEDRLEAQMVRRHIRDLERNWGQYEVKSPRGLPQQLRPRQEREGTGKRFY